MRGKTLFILFFSLPLFAYNWPLKPFNKQHKVTSTFGESRNTRFHTGVDIVPYSTTPTDSFWLVYSLRSDTMLRYNPPDTINNGVYDNDSIYWYIHLTNRVANNTFVTAFIDSIGRVYSTQSLHFVERNPSTLTRINPLRSSGLSPFIDTVSPIIESVSFKVQGSGANIHPDSLHDSIDIVVRVYDPRVDTNGSSAGRGMGIYKIQYEICDTLGNYILGTRKFYKFDSLPPSEHYSLTYYDSTDYQSGIFYYWVTNAPFTPHDPSGDTANQYWNTKQHISRKWNEQPAESIEVAKFPDGFYNVKIKVWDIGLSLIHI